MAEKIKSADEQTANSEASVAQTMTVEEAVAIVKRTVITPPAKKGDEPTTKLVAIKPEEVFNFKDLGDRVVVVTTDGQKFYGDKAATK